MAGYYIPSSFSANYVSNKKNEYGTYAYDSAVNKVGIDAQRSLQQLNKQYNVAINQSHGGSLLANRGLRASALGTGYKQAFAENIQASLNDEVSQISLSVADTKQNIFAALGNQLNQIGQLQQQDVNNMRRMAGSLEQYHGYLQTLQSSTSTTKYSEDYKFNTNGTFEDNYDKIFETQKGIMQNYMDENSNTALSWEDWLRQNSGSSNADTAWLDWVYGGGATQYKDFVGYTGPKPKAVVPISPDPITPPKPKNKEYGTLYGRLWSK
jgi:hypothetical protein